MLYRAQPPLPRARDLHKSMSPGATPQLGALDPKPHIKIGFIGIVGSRAASTNYFPENKIQV